MLLPNKIFLIIVGDIMFSLKGIPYLLFAVTLLFTYYCSAPTEPNQLPTEIIPLKMGNSWSYVRTAYDSTGIVRYSENLTSTINKDKVIDELTWYGYNDTPVGVWFANKSDGYWVFARWNNGSNIVDTMLLVYKCTPIVAEVYDFPSFRREVVAINELISVPACSFKTIHYVDTFIDSSNYLLQSGETFIAKGIGIIKRVQIGRKYYGTKFVVFEEELENCTLN